MPEPDVTVAIVSDIHGVLPALETAYQRILRDHAPDAIVCAGDVAAFGPDPSGCADFLVAHGIPTARGNTDDDMAANGITLDRSTERLRQISDIMNWSRSRLSTRHVLWLASLPFSVSVAETLVCIHAGPNSNTQIVPSDCDPPKVSGAAVVAAGHLHTPFVIRHSQGIWANAGSVSRPTDGDARGAYMVARRQAGAWNVELERFEIDLERVADQVLATDMPHRERWCDTLMRAAWW
jgi:predicted phosphodiesterase